MNIKFVVKRNSTKFLALFALGLVIANNASSQVHEPVFGSRFTYASGSITNPRGLVNYFQNRRGGASSSRPGHFGDVAKASDDGAGWNMSTGSSQDSNIQTSANRVVATGYGSAWISGSGTSQDIVSADSRSEMSFPIDATRSNGALITISGNLELEKRNWVGHNVARAWVKVSSLFWGTLFHHEIDASFAQGSYPINLFWYDIGDSYIIEIGAQTESFINGVNAGYASVRWSDLNATVDLFN